MEDGVCHLSMDLARLFVEMVLLWDLRSVMIITQCKGMDVATAQLRWY